MKQLVSSFVFSLLLVICILIAACSSQYSAAYALIDANVVTVLTVSAGLFLVLGLVLSLRKENFLRQLSFGCAVVMLLTWIYFANPLSSDNSNYGLFEQYSDSLVYSVTEAGQHNVDPGPFGLGYYHDITGEVFSDYLTYKAITPITAPEMQLADGYSTLFPGFVTDDNGYTRNYLIPGNMIRFPSGDVFSVTGQTALTYNNADYLAIEVNSPELLTQASVGPFRDAQLLNADGTPLPAGRVNDHCVSQVGLHGMVMRNLVTILPGLPEIVLPLLCCFAFALAVVAVTILMRRQFGRLPAYSFLLIFAIAPWTMSFARSVYWVEFTWLLPTIVGLIIAANLSVCTLSSDSCPPPAHNFAFLSAACYGIS